MARMDALFHVDISYVLDDTELYEWDNYSDDEEDELKCLIDQDLGSMARVHSTSIAEEFIICVRCSHPIKTQDDHSSGTRTSTPLQHKPCVITSTPCYVDVDKEKVVQCLYPQNESDGEDSKVTMNSSCDVLRDADQSYVLDEDLSVDQDVIEPDERSILKDYNLTLGQCSLLELPKSLIVAVTDLELSDEYLPRCKRAMTHTASGVLCYSCSHYEHQAHRKDSHLTNEHAKPGSRMSVYFPDKTGINLSAELIRSGRRDSMCCSVNSEDSGACDIDDIHPLSHESSRHYNEGSILGVAMEKLQSSLNATKLYDPDTSFEIINTPMEDISASHWLVDKLTSQVDARHKDINEMHKEVDDKFDNVRHHLESTREYYNELVEQWYWKNMIILQREQQQVKLDQEQHAQVAEEAIAEIKLCMEHIEGAKINQDSLARYSTELSQKLQELDQHVNDLKTSVGALTEVTFTVGRSERLTTAQLGGVIIQRRPNTEHVPRMLLPGKCLMTFDSRQGKQSDYMATGLSLTTNGDLIVTDTGLDMVNVFSAVGKLKLNVNIQPGDSPTTAVHFNDMIAVACSNEVKLYDTIEGVYHDTQLQQLLVQPQGVSTDRSGNLVVSAHQVDLPAIGIYDKQTHKMSNVIIGDTRCCTVTEGVTGYEDCDVANNVLFSKPWYVTVDKSDRVVISDREAHCICVVSQSGKLVEEIGSLGHKPGEFFYPAGLCVDPHGRIIVADSQNHRVQVVTPGESLVISMVTQEHDGIECPMDVALDGRGRLYVLQGNGLVSVYQYC